MTVPTTPLAQRLSEALERLEDTYTEIAEDGRIDPAEQGRMRHMFRAVMTLWVQQEAGIRIARTALSHGAASPQLHRLERAYAEDLDGIDAA
jgi:hypothetical protein